MLNLKQRVPVSEWIDMKSQPGTAFSLVANSLGCSWDEAYAQLIWALMDGLVRARFVNGDSVTKEEWQQTGYRHSREVEINRASLLKWLNTLQPRKSNAGRPPVYDWQGCLIAMAGLIHAEGLPHTQAELCEKMREWFIGQIDDHPSDTELKNRARRIFEAVGR